MDAARWERIQALFHEALTLPEPRWRGFLATACEDDPALADEVLALLEEDARDPSLLDRGLAFAAHEVLGETAPVPRQIGPYRVRSVLGRGGMGVVYLAEREDLHSQAAIKVLRDASLSPARRVRFGREQRVLAGLVHPSIARLYDADTLPDGTPYFVMEYVEGVPLTAYCRMRRCSIPERLRLFRAVCEAVQHAHRQAVVHRDLKPSNILVTEDGDGRPHVKLLDFGIAKQLEGLDAPADPTQTGLRLMTPAYAAPEQLRGEPVGVYTDVYALGVVLYELLTGRLPFDLRGLTPGQTENLLLEHEPEKPSKARRAAEGTSEPEPPPTISSAAWADLDVLCLTAMHRDPQRRYATVEALLRDLDHYLRGEPLEARPDTAAYRLGKFLRRNRRSVAAAALAAAVVLGLILFYTVRLAEQRNRARTEAAKADQVSAYLIGLFEASDPYAADSLDARTLLERGAEQAEGLSEQPAVQAQMLDVLGQIHLQLSQYDRADSLLRQALSLRRRLDDRSLDVAETLANRGVLFVYTGAYDSAEVYLREALALREEQLPSDHPDLATNLDDLGVILSRKGDQEASLELKQRAFQIRRDLYDEPHEDLAYSLNNLAVTLYRQGDYAAAERYYREALDVDLAVFGPDHPDVATDLANLGKLKEDQGDYAAAESLLTRALRIRRRALGEAHYETALSLSQLGGLLQQKGDYDQAEAYLRDALAIREEILAPNHPSTATTLSNLASTLRDRGDYDEAEPLFRKVVAAYRASLGEAHWFTGVSLCNLAHLLYLKDDYDEAEPLFREGLTVLEAALPAGHHTVAQYESQFGVLLAAQARFAEAEPLFVASYESLHARFGSEHADVRQAAQRLVELYEGWGKPDQADVYRTPVAEAEEGAGTSDP